MKYYKKKKVVLVTKYEVIKYGCYECRKIINDGDLYYKLYEAPLYPEDGCGYTEIYCPDCINEYINEFLNGDAHPDEITITRSNFIDDDDVDEYSDEEIKDGE